VLPDPIVDDTAEADAPLERRRLALVVIGAMVVVAVLGVWTVFFTGGRPGSPPGSWTLRPYTGLGAWVDVYDWAGTHPTVGVRQIDAMADAGVQTIFLQTSRNGRADDVLEPERLDDLIDRAHARHLHVVAWYLPTLVDLRQDLRRLEAAAALKVDGLAVDIEAVDLPDVAVRNQRVVELSRRLRAAVDRPKVLAAVTLSPVHLEVVNPTYWPGYPWAELARDYDAVLPMAYWTLRRGDLRQAEGYIRDTVQRIRAASGRPDLPVHVIGGLAEGTTSQDLAGLSEAVRSLHAIGGSLYDWSSSTPTQWRDLQPLTALRTKG
jgi:hypothetical protein